MILFGKISVFLYPSRHMFIHNTNIYNSQCRFAWHEAAYFRVLSAWKVCVSWFRHAGIHVRIFLCVCYKHVACSSTQSSSFAVPSCRNDDQPPLQYLAPIFPSSPIPRVSRDFGLPRCRFPCNSFCIAHFTSSQAPSLVVWLKKESLRRTQIRVAIWWCSEYFGLYGYQSNWFATSDNRSTILRIRSFSHQLSA